MLQLIIFSILSHRWEDFCAIREMIRLSTLYSVCDVLDGRQIKMQLQIDFLKHL